MEAFIDLWRGILTRSDFRAGCAVVAVTVAADSPEQLESIRATFRSWRERLAVLLSEGGVSEERARALAATLISACEGAVVLARAERAGGRPAHPYRGLPLSRGAFADRPHGAVDFVRSQPETDVLENRWAVLFAPKYFRDLLNARPWGPP
jgi:hypothetical protein